MDSVNKLLHELNKYGLAEFMYHSMYWVRKKEWYKLKMLTLREKYFLSLNEPQLEKELEEIYAHAMQSILYLGNPQTFTEKIQWMKLYDSTSEKTRLADKYLVREWVAEKIGEEHLVPLLGVWDRFENIDFSSLPDSFCMKMNHGSGMNLVIKDKNTMDVAEAKRLFHSWMHMPFWVNSLERQYQNIPRKIIAEKYIEEMSGGLYDYKFHCFNGRPEFIQCIGDRDLKAHTGGQCNYDLDWNKLDWIFEDYPCFTYDIQKPALLCEMTEYARTLSEGFAYVRVDLYEIDDKIYFGEMTFTPACGIYPYKGTWTREKDLWLGEKIRLNG